MPFRKYHIFFVLLVNEKLVILSRLSYLARFYRDYNLFGKFRSSSFFSKQCIRIGMRDILKTWNTKDLNVIKFYINDIFEFLCAVSNKMTLRVYLLYFHVKCGRKYHYINYLRKKMTEMKIWIDCKIWTNPFSFYYEVPWNHILN